MVNWWDNARVVLVSDGLLVSEWLVGEWLVVE